MPDLPLNGQFEEVVRIGTQGHFGRSTNAAWIPETLPVTAAFFHAKYFLEMAIRCAGRYERVESPLGSDLAGLLYLFNLR